MQTSLNVANPLQLEREGNTFGSPYFSDFGVDVNLSWELDFWGRFRRSVEAANRDLDASVENYDDALVLLISEVASTYVQIRTLQQQLKYIDENIVTQTKLVLLPPVAVEQAPEVADGKQ